MELLRKSSKRYFFERMIAYFLTCGMFFNMSLSIVLAGPEGAQVVNGQVSFQQSGCNTTITASHKAIINYSSFDIARPEVVKFVQPGSSATVLNRILSANPTNINGTLLANGRVFFVNPAGIYIGEGARINVNQLVASALNITNSDFINGRFNFAGGNGSVINDGNISAEKVYLIGKQVANSGSIHCPDGYVVMAAGDRVFLGEPGSDVMVEIDPQNLSEPADLADSGPGVLNQGEVDAAGDRIVLASGDIHSRAISNVGSLAASVEIGNAGQVSNTGTIEARSDTARGGTVIAKAAEVTNSGTVDVTGSEGGEVAMEATGRLGQFGIIHADGTAGDGGNIELRADDVVAISSDSLTTANAGTHGEGGEVIAFSPDTALFREDAQIEAKGGSESGNGGFVEVSGKEHVEVFGLADVSANNGSGGTFFIDPHNVTIQAREPGDLTTNPFTATADGDTVSDNAIEGVINTGGSAVVQTSDGGLEDGDIIQDVDATIDFTGAGGDASLTLNAADDIELNGGIAVTGATASLTVAINANGAYGTASGAGDVDINANIATNGGSFTSSGVDFDNTGGEITAGNVDIDITGSFTCGPGSRITAGGDGTHLDIKAAEITLNAGDVDRGTLTNTGTGTITLNAYSDIFLADHSINVDEGKLNIDSANIRTSQLDEPMVSPPQRAENNSNIMAAAGIGGEIKADGVVSLTAGAVGDRENPLDLDGASALEITATGAGDILILENSSTIKSTDINVDETVGARVYIDYAERADNDDAIAIQVSVDGSHYLGELDLDNDSDSSFSYTAKSGDIILGAGKRPVNMGENGDVTLSTSDDIVFPDWWGEGPLIMTAGGSVSLTADAIYSYTDNGSYSSAPLGIQGATALTLTDTGPGPIELAEVGGSTIGSTSITVGNIDYGTIDIVYDNERGRVDIDDDHFINSVVLPFSFSYTATKGDINIGFIEVTSESPGEVEIIAGGAIRDAEDDSLKPGLDVVGATINLKAGEEGIGTSVSFPDDDVFFVEDRVLEVTASRELNADTAAEGGHILINSRGDLPIGLVDAGKGEVTLNATGTIRDAEDDSAQPLVDVVGTTVNLNALAGGIGTDVLVADDGVSQENRVMEVAASRELNADTTADSGHILISSLGNLRVGLVDAGTGNVTIDASGHALDTDSYDDTADIVGSIVNVQNASEIGQDVTGPIEVTTDILGADTSGNDGDIDIDLLESDTKIDLVDAGLGDVTLDAGGYALDTESYDGIADIVGSIVDLQNASEIGQDVAGPLEVTTEDVFSVDTSGADGNIDIDSIGDLPIGLINVGAGDVTLDSTDAINDASDDTSVDINADMLTLSADDEIGGNPTHGNTTDTLGAIETTVASLNATSTTAGDIVITETDGIILTDVDTVDGDITIVVGGTITATDVQTTDGAVNLTAGGALTATLVSAADASDDEEHDVTLSTTGAGNVTLTSVTADDDIMVSTAAVAGDILISSITAADDISLTATQGAIREAVDYTEDTNIRAVSVQLSAATAIIGNSPIETSARSITARTDGGDIDIDNDNTLPIMASLEVSTGAGNIKFRQTGGGALTAQEATTQEGTIHIEVDSAELTAENITAGGQGNIIVRADGDVKVGNVTALDNQITINSTGAIKESVNDRDVDLTAASLSLTAKDGIGIHRSGESLDIKIPVPIETDAASIVAQTEDNAESSSHIFINVQNTEYTSLEASTVGTGSCIAFRQADGGELTLEALHTNDGSITVGADGNVKVGSITAFDNQITIDSAGAIDDAAVDIVTDFTAETLTLTAYDGIGATAEIETDVSSLSAHSIASDIMIVEKDTTSLDRIILIDVDTIDGRINITVEEAVGATGDTVLTAVDADGDDDEDEVVITAAAGDITIGEVSADNVSLEATNGAMTHQAGKTITAGGGSLAMRQADSLNLKDFTFGNQENTDLIAKSYNGLFTADDTNVANSADKWKSITAKAESGITLKGSGDITTNALTSTNGNIALESTTGAVVMNDTVTTNEGGGVTITAQDDVTAQAITTEAQAVTTNSNIEVHSLGGDLRINDNLTANGGGVSLIADNGMITTGDATAKTGIKLEGPGNITTQALTTITDNISVHSTGGDLILGGAINAYGGHEWRFSDEPSGGGVELIADNGKITSDGDTLNVAITGYSDDVPHRQDPMPDSFGFVSPGETGVVLLDGTGVVLPDESGKAAIVIRSQDNLKLGSSATLTAKGTYKAVDAPEDKGVDDRDSVNCLGGPPETDRTGDPVDVAIYVSSYDLDSQEGGNVTVDCPVLIDRGGTMVIDAENTVNDFGYAFKNSAAWNSGTNGLEVVSRTTQTLDEAVKHGTLPHAKEVRQGKQPTWFGGSKYVLRGKRLAEVLTNVEPAPVNSDQEKWPWKHESTEEEGPEEPPPVTYTHDGEIERAVPDMLLQHGGKIETSAHATAFIEFPDGSVIIMKPETCITIESPGIFVWFGEIIGIIRGGFDVNTDKYGMTAKEPTIVHQRVSKNGEMTAKVIQGRLVVESETNLWAPLDVPEGRRVTTYWPSVRPSTERMSQSERDRERESIPKSNRSEESRKDIRELMHLLNADAVLYDLYDLSEPQR